MLFFGAYLKTFTQGSIGREPDKKPSGVGKIKRLTSGKIGYERPMSIDTDFVGLGGSSHLYAMLLGGG